MDIVIYSHFEKKKKITISSGGFACHTNELFLPNCCYTYYYLFLLKSIIVLDWNALHPQDLITVSNREQSKSNEYIKNVNVNMCTKINIGFLAL